MTVYVVALRSECVRAAFITAPDETTAVEMALRGEYQSAGPWTPVKPDEITSGRVLSFGEEES